MQDVITKHIQESKTDQILAECHSLVLFLISRMTAFLVERGDLDGAIVWMKQLTTLIPEQPLPYSDLAYLFGLQGNFTEAIKYSQKAVDANIPIFEIYQIHGDVLYGTRNYQAAIEAYKKALEIQPDNAPVHFHLSDCLMRVGRQQEGLEEHEWRLKAIPKYVAFCKRYNKPIWDGKSDLAGKTILVANEQGIGDAIQFCRYLPELKKHGCKVIVEVQDELVNLFKQLDVDQVCGRSHNQDQLRSLPSYDFVTYFTSFPYLFDPDCTTRHSKYLSPQNVQFSGEKEFRVGLCWAGNPNHHLDYIRSCHLRQFAPLANIPGVRLFSLQKGPMHRTWGNLMTGSEDIKLVDTSDQIDDMKDTANLIGSLNLVITVDTAVAHLAGAMGKPVWMLIANDLHDRRWGESGDKTPWYDSMRIFRQKISGNWDGVVGVIAETLKEQELLK